MAQNKSLKKAGAGLKQYGMMIMLIVVYLLFAIITKGKNLTPMNINNLIMQNGYVVILAVGMLLCVLTGNVDLCVGSVVASTGAVAGTLIIDFGWSAPAAMAAALAVGALFGVFVGFFVAYVDIPPFIVTLATMLIYRSVAQYYLRTLRLSIYNMDGTLSAYDPFYKFGQYKVAGLIPMAGVILILVTVLMVFMSTNTKFGRSIYAIGSNERAARLAGINVEWTQVAVYTITGLLCGVSTFMWLAMNGSVDPATIGKSNEMYAIAAVVIGGISMSGGKGKLLGVLFGAMSYTIIDKIIASMGLDALINDTIKGSILLLAVFIQIAIPAIRAKFSKSH